MTYVPTAVGIDIFQGGFTLGVVRAGFDNICNLEEGDFGNKTFKANFPQIPVHIGAGSWPIKELAKKDVDLAYANPPCVVFSAAALSRKDTWRQKAELSCTLLTFDTFEQLRPAVAIWECVPRAWTMGRELVDHMTERFLKLGYSVTYLLQDARVLGVPQRRQRFMFIAHVVRLFPELPVDPHVMTVDEALAGMEPNMDLSLSPGLANALMHSERTTGRRHDLRAAWDEINQRGVDKGRPKMMDHRVDGNTPCSTITGMISQIHPREDRYFAPNEVARLCSYPDDFKWVYKNATDFQQQCCKAVLPNVGEYAARMVMDGLNRGELTHGEVKIFDFRKWAQWQTDRQIFGETEKPEPKIAYTPMAFQGSLWEDASEIRQAKAPRPKKEVFPKPEDAAAIKVVAALSNPMVSTPKNNGNPIRVVGYDEKGPIRSRREPLIVDGKVVRRRIGNPGS